MEHNKLLQEEFIAENQDTEHFISKINEIEDKVDKHIYDFTISEIEEFINNFDEKENITEFKEMLKEYIDLAIVEGYVEGFNRMLML